METLFKEEQRFRQWWIWVLLAVVTGVMVYRIIQQIVFGNEFGTNPTSSIVLIMSSLIPIGIGILFYKISLILSITKSGISFQLKPFKPHYIDWNEVENVYVKKYNPILEYGGWGYRVGLNGKAYNIGGNQGLQLELKSGEKILIGTQKSDELRMVLKKLDL